MYMVDTDALLIKFLLEDQLTPLSDITYNFKCFGLNLNNVVFPTQSLYKKIDHIRPKRLKKNKKKDNGEFDEFRNKLNDIILKSVPVLKADHVFQKTEKKNKSKHTKKINSKANTTKDQIIINPKTVNVHWLLQTSSNQSSNENLHLRNDLRNNKNRCELTTKLPEKSNTSFKFYGRSNKMQISKSNHKMCKYASLKEDTMIQQVSGNKNDIAKSVDVISNNSQDVGKNKQEKSNTLNRRQRKNKTYKRIVKSQDTDFNI